MAYYDNKENVEQYIKMAEGYDGQVLIDELRKYVPDGSTVLELGMGAGKDLLLLNEHYTVTGSDNSQIFIDRFRAKHAELEVMKLDAVNIETEKRFDAIYSNKVLYHLTRDQLAESLKQAAKILNPNGIALHSFWHGEGNESMHGLHFAYYTENTLREVIGAEYDIVKIERYTEDAANDSLYVVLKKHDEED